MRVTPTGHHSLLVASYNIHRGFGRDGSPDTDRIAEVVREVSPHVIALQEVDSAPDGSPVPGQLEMLEKRLGLETVSGVTLRHDDACYGNAIMSSLPIDRVRLHDLSVARAEPRGVIDVDLRFAGRTVRLLATHLGLQATERRIQAARLGRIVGARDHVPTLLAGDFNEWKPGSRSLAPLARRFGRWTGPRTYPARLPLFRLDRIWADARAWKVEAVWAHRSPLSTRASDHLPVCARLRLRQGDSRVGRRPRRTA